MIISYLTILNNLRICSILRDRISAQLGIGPAGDWMKRKEISLSFLGLLLMVSIIGLTPVVRAQSQPVLSVAASIAPLAGLVNEVGGAHIDITVMLAKLVYELSYPCLLFVFYIILSWRYKLTLHSIE